MENEKEEFKQPSPVVIPEEPTETKAASSPVTPDVPTTEAPVTEGTVAEAPVTEAPVAEVKEASSLANIPPVEVTSPEMNKVEAPVVKEEPKKEKKKGSLGGILAVILVLVLLVGGGYFYLRMSHTGEKFLEFSFNKAINLVKEGYNLVKDVDYNVADYKLSGDAKLTASGEGLDALNNINVDYSLDMSLKNEYIYAKVKLNQDSVTTDLSATVDGNTIYANLGDLYDKTIKYTSEENPFTSLKESLSEVDTSASMADLEYILEKELEYSKQALLLSTITTEYNGLNVTYKYVVNESNFDKINSKYAELVKADEKLMKLLEVEEPVLIDSNLTITITSNLINNELEALDIVDEDVKVNVSKKEKNHYLAVIEEQEDKYNLDITIKGNETTINVKDKEGADLGTLIIDDRGNSSHIAYSYKDENYDASVAMDLIMDSANKYKATITFAAIVDSSKINLNVNINSETKEGLVTKSIPDSAVALEEMGDELLTLEDKITTRIGEYKFYSLIQALTVQDADYDMDVEYQE